MIEEVRAGDRPRWHDERVGIVRPESVWELAVGIRPPIRVSGDGVVGEVGVAEDDRLPRAGEGLGWIEGVLARRENGDGVAAVIAGIAPAASAAGDEASGDERGREGYWDRFQIDHHVGFVAAEGAGV